MEAWKNIRGFPGYQVSSAGRVASFKTRTGGSWHISDRARRYLAAQINRSGRPWVILCHRGITKKRLIATLVAEAFLDNPSPIKQDVCYRDADPGNCAADNLYWGTRQQLLAANGSSYRLSKEQVLAVRGRIRAGERTTVLANEFGVAPEIIRKACKHGYAGIPGGVSLTRSKLTDRQVEEIRQMYVPGEITMREVGKRFGVTESAVSRIVNRNRRT